MIIRRPTDETCVDRERLHRRGNSIQLGTVGDFVTAVISTQPSEKRNESGKKEEHATCGPQKNGPRREKVPPQKGENREIRPNHNFRVVPFPRSKLYETAQKKNRDRWQNKIRGIGTAPFWETAFANDAEAEGKGEKGKSAEIDYPKREEVLIFLHPSGLPSEDGWTSKKVSDEEHEKRCRKERGEEQRRNRFAVVRAANEPASEEQREKEEGMQMKNRH